MAETGGPEDFSRRLRAVERRVEEVAIEAAAARHLAASGDRDLADLTARVLANQRATDGVGARIGHLEGRVTRLEGKVDAQTAAINNLSVQTGERFAQIDQRFAQIDQRFAQIDQRFAQIDQRFDAVDAGFADIRARLDQTAAGLDLIVRLLTPGTDPTES